MTKPKVCSEPGCPELDCQIHKRDAWRPRSDNPRYQVGGYERARRRLRILKRHQYVCHVCGRAGADQADHVIPLSEGGPDTEANMRPIHAKPCHKDKTAAEALRARRRI